jgi:hypothetical protein
MAFAADLCSKKRKEEMRFSRKEILAIAREIKRYPHQKWMGDIAIFHDNLYNQIENARRFFNSRFDIRVENSGFISMDLTRDQVERMRAWHNQTTIDSIQMPTEQTFYLKVYLAVSLWRQEEGSRINYLLGKGIGTEIALRGNVLKRIKRPLRFSYRPHSDFELYGVDYQTENGSSNIGKSPYPEIFYKVFGSQEYYPLTKTKGLSEIPNTLLMNTAEIVNFGGIRLRIPELEILFLDKYMRPGSFHRSEGTDAEVLARQYVLNKKKILHYYNRFVAKHEFDRIQQEFQKAFEEQISAIKQIFQYTREEILESGNQASKAAILGAINRRIQPLLDSNASWGGIRMAYWVPVFPNQIDDNGGIVDANLIGKIKEKIQIRNDSKLRDINGHGLDIDKLLSSI